MHTSRNTGWQKKKKKSPVRVRTTRTARDSAKAYITNIKTAETRVETIMICKFKGA